MNLLAFLTESAIDSIFGKGKNRPMTPEGFQKFGAKLNTALKRGTHQDSQVITLAGNRTLTGSNPGAGETVITASVFLIDPGGASRDLTIRQTLIPPGLYFVVNTADAAEDLVVKNASGTTILTVSQNESGWFVNTGTTLHGATGART